MKPVLLLLTELLYSIFFSLKSASSSLIFVVHILTLILRLLLICLCSQRINIVFETFIALSLPLSLAYSPMKFQFFGRYFQVFKTLVVNRSHPQKTRQSHLSPVLHEFGCLHLTIYHPFYSCLTCSLLFKT